MGGVFGLRSPERDVARIAYFGLFALQHRGQESAGIAVSDAGRLTVLRDLGLVSQVFDERKLSGLRGRGRELHALLGELRAQRGRVRQVPVVAERERALAAVV